MTPESQGLQQSLSGLAASAALLDLGSAEQAAALADGLSAWLQEAVLQDPALSPLILQVQRVAEGLRRGLALAPGLERLFQILERCQAQARPAEPPPPGSAAVESPARPGLVPVQDDDRESWQDFLDEVPQLLQSVEEGLVSSLRGEAFDASAVLRPLHTLKGICGMLGLAAWGGAIHAAEDVLEPFKAAKALPSTAGESVLGLCDLLRRQVDAIAVGVQQGGFELLDAGACEQALLAAGSSPAAAGLQPAAAQASSVEDSGTRSAENVIRIPVAKMDALLEAVSELAICQSQVTEGVLSLDLQGSLSMEASRLAKISRQLQEVVLGLRMVPVAPLFTRINRQVYDLSRRMGKQVRLELSGGETEVDKGMIEDLFEPLLHLVRNALDHGLETPDERRQAAKPEEGSLRLAAFHEGGEFVLQMSDDGRGFDLEAIAAKARSQGLLRHDEEAAPERLIELLFESGFSTASALTDLSGRGVGLDAVRRRVQALKGSVAARGQRGQGSIFTLRLPLTLALMDAVLVRVGMERYALPAAAVRRFFAWDATQRHGIGSQDPWYEAPGVSLPLVDMGATGEGRAVAMHVSSGGREACLMVDEVIGKQQVVVKGLGELLKDLPGIAGGAVLSDGRVGLILDLASLLQQRGINAS